MNKLRCYVASPLGFSESGRYWYSHVLLPILREHFDVIDPWTLAGPPGDTILCDSRFCLDLGLRNFAAIDTCQVLVAILDGEPPDNGTVAEVAWAAKAGLQVIGYRNDFRQSGESGVPVNLMVPAAIQHSGGKMVGPLVELVKTLHNMRAREPRAS